MTPALMVRDLVVRNASGRALLTVPSLDVAPGEALVVRGPSGAGKSTLLFALAGLITAAEGSICWGGLDLARLNDAARTKFRRETLGIIFQDHLLFEELTSLGNAALPASFAPRTERSGITNVAGQALERLGIEQGGRRATSYSGGERQRIAVARALATNPPVILADEPTASLDRASADQLVEDLFGYVGHGRTLIIASHDAAVHARARRLASVVDGKLRISAHA